jgi:hypothetical protein
MVINYTTADDSDGEMHAAVGRERHERAALAAMHGPKRPEKKVRARYADAAWFRAIAVRIARPAGSGAHFQTLDGPGNQGPLGGD